MKKILRYSLMMLFAAVGTSAMAQDVVLDFTNNDWNLPTDAYNKTEQPYSYGGYTIKFGASGGGHKFNWNDNKDQSKGGYVIFGKTNATLVLPTFDFDVQKIEFVGRTDASGAVKHNIYVGDDAVSTTVTGAKGTSSFAIKPTAQAAGTVYVLKVESNHNMQFTKINIYKATGVNVPEISGETVFNGSTTVTITGDDGADIYYTTDGNTPTISSTKYTAPFTLTASATVKAIAVKGGTTSDVASESFIKLEGAGTETNPYTIADLLSLPVSYTSSEAVWVKGIIVGSIKDNKLEETPSAEGNIALAATAGETVWANIVPVQLPTGDIRTALNVVSNPSNIGKEVLVKGNITAYFSVTGVKETSDYKLDTTGISAVTTDDVDAPAYDLQGRRVDASYRGIVIKNGKKMIQK